MSLAALLLLTGCFLPTPKKDDQTTQPTQQQTVQTPAPPATPQAEFEATARDLAAVYEENEVLADKNYKGKWIEVTGIITQIGKDFMDMPYIVLDTEDQMNQVQCVISEGMALQLKKGQQITVLGKCEGLTLLSVIIDDCKEYKIPKEQTE